jgi:hypothetical protein
MSSYNVDLELLIMTTNDTTGEYNNTLLGVEQVMDVTSKLMKGLRGGSMTDE